MRIVIAEDDFLLREGLALLLRAESLDVVATSGNPEGFLAAIDVHRPDVAIVDVRMPPTHTDEGIVAAVEARRRQPDLAVLVLSAYVEQSFATELLAAVPPGRYLLKERVGQLLARTRPDSGLNRLSPRERDVLALMAEGLGNLAIAERLFVSESAVQKYIRSIFARLDLLGPRRLTSSFDWSGPRLTPSRSTPAYGSAPHQKSGAHGPRSCAQPVRVLPDETRAAGLLHGSAFGKPFL
jgi:DNA-binding NarL/FixJ family response regulator